MELRDGEHELIEHIPGYKYPVKIVIFVERNIATVITNYPLKKGKKI